MKSKESLFADLVSLVRACRLCPRMVDRHPVLGAANGSLSSPVVFLAEAPGRLGADKYRIPLHGDQTGHNFEALIGPTRLTREHIFITNAVLCNPRTATGTNATPTANEIRNCSTHLRELLAIIWPAYIVPLGARALAALHAIVPHDLRLARDAGTLSRWNGFSVYPMYHPSPRVLARVPLSRQEHQYRVLDRLLYGQ